MRRFPLNLFDISYCLVGVPWLFLMLFTSRSLTEVKTAMLILLVLVCLAEIFLKRINCYSKQFGFVIVFSVFAIIEIIIGQLNGFSFDIWDSDFWVSDFYLIQYFIATPLFAFIISSVIRSKPKRRKCLWIILKYMTLALAVLDLLRILLFMVIM